MRLASLVACLVCGVSINPAYAQQTTVDVLSFLLTNRTIITGDFDRDAQAAAATRDTIATFAPLCPSARAIDSPMPRLPPVTRATLPST